jgi:2-polyprenyl-6-hydroxyphenyl methylase/3-demethylubiquinone-9 3-methyltransferase
MSNSQRTKNGHSDVRDLPDSITVDQAEINKFQAIAQEWWDPSGKFRPLHKLNPTRLAYIRDQICRHFGRDIAQAQPLSGLRLLDIGCGGGLLSEPMARLGAEVIGVDAAEKNIKVAAVHANKQGLKIEYRATTIEDLAQTKATFDIVINMEVVEHVANVGTFLQCCVEVLKPGGLMVIGTINRTLKAYALAIVGAETVLRWLPHGTHQFKKLVRPEELEEALAGTDIDLSSPVGLSYNPILDRWCLSDDIAVNYMRVAIRPED